MILHLARVFYQAMFLQKIKLDPSVKNGKFSEVKTLQKVFLSFLYFLFFPSQQNFLSVYAMVVVKVCFRSMYEFLVLGGSSSEPLHSMHLMVLLPRSV